MLTRQSFSYPWTWVALTINLAGAVFLVLWFRSDSLAVAAGLAGGAFLIGVVSWLLLILRGGDFKAYLQSRRDADQSKDLDTLKQDLERLNNARGQTQLIQFGEKLQAFMDVLKLRFSADELTYQRYQHTAELVHEGGLQNLRNLRAALESIKTVDIQALEARLARMSDSDAEKPTLLRRRALHTEQMAKAERLLVENEEAITALTNVTTALANTDTDSSLETGHAIEALEALAKRTDRYAAAPH